MKKKWMKWTSVFCAATICAAALAGCGGNGTFDDTASAGAAPSSEAASAAQESAAASAVSGSQVDKIKAAGKIVMVTNAEFEPFEYHDGDKIVGIDVDISQKIADKLGVKLEITDIAFDSCIPSIQSGKADFTAAGMTATEDRKKNVDFSDTYFNASQAIIVKKGDTKIKSAKDLDGKVVGVQTGTTGDTYCTNEKGENDIHVQEVKRYNKGMDAVSDLATGRLDAVVIDNYPAEKLVAKNPDKVEKLSEPLTEEEYAIAVPKGSDLKNTINEVLKDLKSSGELDKIISKYIQAE